MEQDVLVVAADTAAAMDALAELGRHGQVTQLLPPRLALVVPGAGGPAGLARLPGISVHADGPPHLDDLTEAERLFIDAWWSRRAGKDRPGDGLPWDAPGFQAPH